MKTNTDLFVEFYENYLSTFVEMWTIVVGLAGLLIGTLGMLDSVIISFNISNIVSYFIVLIISSGILLMIRITRLIESKINKENQK